MEKFLKVISIPLGLVVYLTLCRGYDELAKIIDPSYH